MFAFGVSEGTLGPTHDSNSAGMELESILAALFHASLSARNASRST